MRKTLDPTAGSKDSLDGNIPQGVDHHNEQGQQQEGKIIRNFQPKELAQWWGGIEIDQDCERSQR